MSIKCIACALLLVIAQSTLSSFAERIEGDFLIGAVIPVHKNKNGSCEEINYAGLAVSEAIRFAIEEINKDDKLLGELTIDRRLGLDIRDTCGSIETEKDIAYQYNGVHRNYKEGKTGQIKPVSAVIGEFKGTSIEAMKLLNFEKIPQVSYAAENAKLKPDGIDAEEIGELLSVYPEDVTKGKVVASIIDQLKVEYTTLIARNSARGRKGVKLIQDELKKVNRCYSESDLANSDRDIKKLVQAMKMKKVAKIAVLHCDLKDTVTALMEAERLNLTEIVWISTQSMMGKIDQVNQFVGQVDGMMYIRSNDPDQQGFKAYLNAREMNSQNQSMWMKAAYKEQGGEDHCTEKGKVLSSQQQDNCQKTKKKTEKEMLKHQKVAAYAIDAVYTIATGLQTMLASQKPENLLASMKKLDFQSTLTKSKIHFNDDGQVIAESYVVYNVQGNTSASLKEVEVGSWKRDAEPSMTLEMQKVLFKNGQTNGPVSKCSPDCVPGQEIIYPSDGPKCCWSCAPCPNFTASNETNSKCFECAEHQTPNLKQSACEDFKVLHLKLKHPVSEFALFLLTIGFLFTFFAMFIFNQNKDCEVMKMANNETMQAMLLGVIVVFVSSTILIFKPSITVCITYTAIFNVGLTIIFAAMISKTWTFRRMFYGSDGKVNGCGSKPGLFVGLLLVIVEAAIMAIGIYLENITLLFDNTEDWNIKYIECSLFRGMAFWIAYGFPIVLSVLVNFLNCGVPNVEARFGEYKWLCMTMCCFYLVAFLYIAAFWAFPLLQKIEVGVILTILHCFVFLLAYIYPKLHMVLFMEREKMQEIAKSENTPLFYDDEEEEAAHSPTSGIDVFKNRIVQLQVESEDGKSSDN